MDLWGPDFSDSRDPMIIFSYSRENPKTSLKKTLIYNKYYGQSKRYNNTTDISLQDVSCIVCFGRSIYYKAI